MKCCVCSADRECVVLTLTDDEKAAIRAMGQTPQETLAYCRPCFRLLSNPEQGAQLIRGTFQVGLQNAGIANAEKLARRYYDFLLSKAKRRN